MKARLVLLLAVAAPAVATASLSACGNDSVAIVPVLQPGDGGAGAPSPADREGPRDAADGPADAADDGAPRLSPTYVHRDVNHVLATGQSLSVGAGGAPPLTTAQPYDNVMFVGGPMNGATGLTSFVPLVEGDKYSANGAGVETMSSAFANLVTKAAREELMVGLPAGSTSHDLLVSAHGVGGTAYAGLKKGTVPYANGMAQVVAARDLAKAAGESYVVRAVTTVHGESDHIAGNAAYAADLAAWQADYEADVRALTGQGEPIPMLQTQIASWTKLGSTTSAIPIAQLAAHVASQGRVVLVGPKYHLPYVADGVHLTNAGYRHMGEDYAKVYRRVILEGEPWEPVRPKVISRVGTEVTVTFHVPSPPLVLDEALVTNPGAFGFEAADGAGATTLPITSVTLAGPDAVRLVLSRVPKGAARLRYAFTGAVGAPAGPTAGPRGNVRDSDATASRSGQPLYNWCVHFDEALP